MIKACKRCGQDFDARRFAKYCPDCRHEARRERDREYQCRYRERNREQLRERRREYYRRKKLKLIREILSTAKEALDRGKNL